MTSGTFDRSPFSGSRPLSWVRGEMGSSLGVVGAPAPDFSTAQGSIDVTKIVRSACPQIERPPLCPCVGVERVPLAPALVTLEPLDLGGSCTMILDSPRTAMARAFRETVLSLVGVFRVYEVDHELADATADTLGRVFRRHLARAVNDDDFVPTRCALHALADELEELAEA